MLYGYNKINIHIQHEKFVQLTLKINLNVCFFTMYET